jgi:tetratricopeptide (TPR) repeat protein
MADSSTVRAPRPSRAATLVIVFAVALLARGLYLLQLRAAPFFAFHIGDAKGYHDWALRIAGGEWVGQEVFYQAPLYPYFLGTLYAGFSDDVGLVRLVQVVLGSIACVLIADAARRLFSPKAGLLAGLLLALYPPAIFFDALIQKSVLDGFFLALSLRLLVAATESGRKAPWFLAGVAIGGLVLSRENALVFVGAIGLWLGWTAWRIGPRQLVLAALFVAGLATVLSPVVVRNRIVGGGFYLTTSQLGPNLYIGNNPKADGTYRPLRAGRGNVRFERQDATALAEQALGRKLTPAEVSGYWTGEVLRYVREQPAEWMQLMLRKAWLVWNAIELEDSEDLHTFLEWSPPIAALARVWHFGVLAPFAVLGLFITWRERRRLGLFYLLLAAYAASVTVFYVFARYRYPLVPFLILFAAAGLAGAASWLGSSRRLALVGAGVATLGMAVASNWPTPFEQGLGAATRHSIGNHLRRAGEPEAAERYYREALAIHPNMARAHLGLAELLRESGRVDAAVDHYRKGIALQQRRGATVGADVHYGFGLAYLARRQLHPALDQFEIATARNPLWPVPLNASAWLLATDPDPSVRRPERALRLAEQANSLAGKRSATVLDTLAAAQAASGDFERARTTAQAALTLAEADDRLKLADEIRTRLALYERSEPFIQRSGDGRQ